MIEEKQLKQCKICNEVKLRIYDGKYSDGKNTIWIGEKGTQWNGRICPECQVAKMKNHMQVKRASQS